MFCRKTPVDIGPLETFLVYEYTMLYPSNSTEEHAIKTIKDFRKTRSKRIWKEFPIIPVDVDGIRGIMELRLEYRIYRRGRRATKYEIRLEFPKFSIIETQDITIDKNSNKLLTLETKEILPDTIVTASIGRKVTDIVDIPSDLHDIFFGIKVNSITQSEGTNFNSIW